MTTHEQFMLRALELAALGRGFVSPNPMVGCVIVYEASDREPRIIGEGWHRQYGSWHAEVNAVQSVAAADDALLPESTVYVTLEPCSHFGKTPPCADLLISKRVKRVICCNDDPNPLVAGKGFQKLREAGIEVITGVLAEQGRRLNARFFTMMEQQRPYILLKWAETADGYLAGPDFRQVQISGPMAQRFVHRWRTEEDAIMVGTNTARHDNPKLNVRLWPAQPGQQPIRIVIDKNGTLPETLHLFDGSQPTLIYTLKQPQDARRGEVIVLHPEQDFLPQLLADLHKRKVQSVLAEGGTTLLNSLLDAGLWDEMRVFRSPNLLGGGIKAPTIQGTLLSREPVGDDELWTLVNPSPL
ncbi:bifunctional diaminohydroxyphosphoribosylaminopyrimidine deaminase/5-amino-6-(5-phosphoribosylamino)uracil reductase RibD [Arsenicibacter rosenii]|uniref:Riboflavin biosynthesis protein RibD n=1 Tax=Arsenicibacter rosenii TaxID=1750698 RepID=A0A1S2VH31_9BACT|nr:bifunctional diaminohydroxyphosphoribosylaminopyrimidine deaminase/5-amino-6-(5-phosphoribosylamino)uracil reductase RibD [Arsenicibacter rosenii]OIN58077.1 riboflavin biosynthesis protein RibD [Arsenicibacter rosenii]